MALDHARAIHERRVPVVLASAEVWQILPCITVPAYRVCLTLIYVCGLRLMEALRLQVGDIDSVRFQVHVRGGKGGKDRYVPLPAGMVPILREHWKSHGLTPPPRREPASARAGGHCARDARRLRDASRA
ncbi:MAG: tyrosine-type recombinase/integrase [Gemmatimonadaceae bacterium]